MVQPLSHHNALELIDAPAITPITLAEAKDQLRVDTSDEDTIITRLIAAAVAYVDVHGVLGKGMITQKWGQWVGQNPATVLLSLGPVQNVTAVKYHDLDGDEQTDTLANYEIFGTAMTTSIKPKSGFNWPTAQARRDAIKIEYQVGYGDATSDVPDNIRHALLMLVAHWYEHREQAVEARLQTTPYGFDELLGVDRARWYG